MPNRPQTPDEEERDERAAALAEEVKQEADAVTERVERRAEALEERRAGQAEALEERRVEHRLEERIEQRSDLKDELHNITEAIGLLVSHMDQSLPEERVKQMADAVLAEERLGRKRLTTKIVGFLVVILLLLLSSLIQSASNARTLNEAKKVSVYVENCLQHPERLSVEERAEECGGGDNGTVQAVRRLLVSINCSLLISPEARTEANTNACAAKAFGR